jgi:plastocyanin
MINKAIITIGVIIVVFAGIFIWRTTKHSTPVKKIYSKAKPLPKVAIVTLDKNGFSPKDVSVKVGSAVRWVNKSGAQQTVNSDNYPTNQLHRELNFGVFNNGSSFVYTFTKPGTYGYHNQFNAKQKGEIIVVK